MSNRAGYRRLGLGVTPSRRTTQGQRPFRALRWRGIWSTATVSKRRRGFTRQQDGLGLPTSGRRIHPTPPRRASDDVSATPGCRWPVPRTSVETWFEWGRRRSLLGYVSVFTGRVDSQRAIDARARSHGDASQEPRPWGPCVVIEMAFGHEDCVSGADIGRVQLPDDHDRHEYEERDPVLGDPAHGHLGVAEFDPGARDREQVDEHADPRRDRYR